MNQPFKDEKNKLIFEVPFSICGEQHRTEEKENSNNSPDKVIPFRAAGMCFYVENPLRIMMIKSKDRGYEFPGGKIDQKDQDLLYTAIRESVEETNCKIFKKHANNIEKTILYLKNYISRNSSIRWMPEFKFKYGLFLIRLPNTSVFSTEVYGQMEEFEKIDRTISWLSKDEVVNIINDNSISKFALLRMNTYLKKNLLSWLSSRSYSTKIWIPCSTNRTLITT